MGVNQECKLLCAVTIPFLKDAVFIEKTIADDYACNWVINGLPAATEKTDQHTDEKYYNIGFSLGYIVGKSAALNNHYDIYVYYHSRASDKNRVVGVVVKPSSKNTKLKDGQPECNVDDGYFSLMENPQQEIVYTYTVTWLVIYDGFAMMWFVADADGMGIAFDNRLGNALGQLSAYP